MTKNKTNHFSLLVFDWDGTLMDSTATITAALRAACIDLGIAVPTAAEAQQCIGLGVEDTLAALAPTLPRQAYGELIERYRQHYFKEDQTLTLFPGVTACLATLAERGQMMAVATGKSRRGLERALAHSGLAHYFIATRTADECFSKPHPAMLEELMAETGTSPAEVLMIGDTTYDMDMAHNAGTAALAVGYGAHAVEKLQACQPLAVLPTFDALHHWLCDQVN